MNIKNRLQVEQPEEYQKLKKQFTKLSDSQQENHFIVFILWLDKLLDRPIKKLLNLRKRAKYGFKLFC